jgi:DnaD/phage-associated family protein
MERGVGLPEKDVVEAAEPVERANVYTLYEEDIGVLTPLIAEEIDEAESIYPEGWIEDAIRIAAENNARRWSYVRGILERWERDGRGDEADRRGGEEARGRDSGGPYAGVVRH